MYHKTNNYLVPLRRSSSVVSPEILRELYVGDPKFDPATNIFPSGNKLTTNVYLFKRFKYGFGP